MNLNNSIYKSVCPNIGKKEKANRSLADFYYFSILFLIICVINISCKKLVKIDEPVNTITSSEAFNNEATATSALIGVYNDFDQSTFSFGNGMISLYAGISADELQYFFGSDDETMQFYNNALLSNNSLIFSIWRSSYNTIYRANSVIEGAKKSSALSANTKNQLIGEAEFLRSYCYFYLINLFGDVPLVSTTDWSKVATSSRSSKDEVYQQMVNDLEDAQNLLKNDYSISNGNRTRVNKWVAKALLARIYLYLNDYAKSEDAATSVINNTSLYSLVDLNNVFLVNSNESIWQLETYNVWPFSTAEALKVLPPNNFANPRWYLTDQLLSSFEPGDQRRVAWVDSTTYSGTTYFYPFKYKVRIGSTVSENYMMLRLAELYLIRAESRAKTNNLSGAINDLNVIRTRANLTALSSSLTQSQILAALAQERRVELFAEWGNRWLDLKRTGQVTILNTVKPQFKASSQLFPIPYSETTVDHNLVQNPGY